MISSEVSKIAFSILAFSIALIIPYLNAAEDEQICSMADPDTSQTCISIKFPWKEDPVYFCTAKENVNYIPQCDDQYASSANTCYDDGRNDTLKIATPWDCCPHISTPNHCVNVKCPPKPFNRTCTDVRTVGTCCSNYFCDDEQPSSCKLKRMKSSCMKPPADKANCTVYRDPYGCCVKYQCPEDEKPGNCSTTGTFGNYKQPHPPRSSSSGFGSATATSGKLVVTTNGKSVVSFVSVSHQSNTYGNEMQCIGDHTCPDDLKCCPTSTSVYPSSNQNHWNGGTYSPQSSRNQIKLIDGVCRKPATPPGESEDTKDTMSSSTG